MSHNIPTCPTCGSPVMHVPVTGLVSCLAQLKFQPCRWHVRLPPWDPELSREKKMTKLKLRLLKEQEEVQRRIDAYEKEQAKA